MVADMTLYSVFFVLWLLLAVAFLCIATAIIFFMLSSLYILIISKGGPDAPFVPLPTQALSQLVQRISVNENDIVYDLGCGEGRVVRALWSAKKKGSYVGIERNLFVYCLAYVYTRFFYVHRKKAKIQFIFGDIFKQDLRKATCMTMYLFPGVLKALQPKLEKELKRGTLVYSVDFQFPEKEPKEVISLNRGKTALARHIYVYEF